jgi:hypothetical protein
MSCILFGPASDHDLNGPPPSHADYLLHANAMVLVAEACNVAVTSVIDAVMEGEIVISMDGRVAAITFTSPRTQRWAEDGDLSDLLTGAHQ